MGFRFALGAPFLPCWAEGGNICVQELNGRTSRYETSLKITTQKQLLGFQSSQAMWCLHQDGILYVGRSDRTYSGFRDEDGVLVRYGYWKYPYLYRTCVIGTYRGSRAVLDLADHRTVYVEDSDKVYYLNSPIHDPVAIEPALAGIILNSPVLEIYVRGVKLDERTAGTWINAPVQPGSYMEL